MTAIVARESCWKRTDLLLCYSKHNTATRCLHHLFCLTTSSKICPEAPEGGLMPSQAAIRWLLFSQNKEFQKLMANDV